MRCNNFLEKCTKKCNCPIEDIKAQLKYYEPANIRTKSSTHLCMVDHLMLRNLTKQPILPQGEKVYP